MVSGGREGSKGVCGETSHTREDHPNALAEEAHPVGPVPQPALSPRLFPTRQPAHESRPTGLVRCSVDASGSD